MKYVHILIFLLDVTTISYGQKSIAEHKYQLNQDSITTTQYIIEVLDSIFRSEQEPITARDKLFEEYGAESQQVSDMQLIADQNHDINEAKISELLSKYGWPSNDNIGERGNRTICNVIQHSDNDVRISYLPLMKEAVKKKGLPPRFVVRTEDRIATERRDLQLYGGQMKYYPKTKSFNVWPVFDPENIDVRRAKFGLSPIAEHLRNRFNFEWNLEEQLLRTAAFLKELNKSPIIQKYPQL